MFHRLNRKLMVCLILVLAVIFTGCWGEKEKKPIVQQGPKIGVSLADMQRDGNQVIKQVFEQAKKKDRAQITWMDAKGDPVQQQKDIQKLIEEKVKVVILQVTDPSVGSHLVEQLAQNNIKVIALETLPENTPVDAYITSDHRRTGELQVRYLQTLLQQSRQLLEQGKVIISPEQPQQQQGQQQGSQQQGGQQQGNQQQGGQQQAGRQQMIIPPQQQAAVALQNGLPMKVVVLQGDSGDQMAKEITAAVQSGLEGIENIDILQTAPHPRWDENLAKATMQQILSEHPDIDAVLANDSHLAMAAVEVLKQTGMEHRVITVGAGGAPKAVQAIAGGDHDAEVDNRPDMLAQLAYDAAKTMAEGRAFQYDTIIDNGDYTVPAKIVPPRLVHQQNIYLLQDRMEAKGEQQQGGQQQQGQQQQQQQAQQQGQQQGQQGQQQQQQGQQGDQQGQQKTNLRITTSDGKVVEVQIDGQVQSIESDSGGEQQQQSGQGGQGGGGQGGQGGGS